MFNINFTKNAVVDMAKLERSEPNAFKKLEKLLAELRVHPTTGTGKPEQLKGHRVGEWSRRITKKHRLVYRICDNAVEVLLLSAYGHYE